MGKSELAKVVRLFMFYDKDSSGEIDLGELKELLKAVGIKQHRIEQEAKRVMADATEGSGHAGKLDLSQFLVLVGNEKQYQQAFRKLELGASKFANICIVVTMLSSLYYLLRVPLAAGFCSAGDPYVWLDYTVDAVLFLAIYRPQL